MKHIALTPFGRQPVTAALIAARQRAAQHQDNPPSETVDKWTVFDDLRAAKSHFGLKDRDLAVLHGLLSFMPAKIMKLGDNLVVFPSNHSLSERLHGMAESTLRRHIAALVGAGLIWRRDSSNGKRYATRGANGQFDSAFGFDLTPLLLRSLEIGALANEMRAAEAELNLARQRLVLNIRDCGKLIAYLRENANLIWQSFDDQMQPLRQALRRKMSFDMIADLQSQSAKILREIMGIIEEKTENTGVSAAQNERHYSNSNIESLDLNCIENEELPSEPVEEIDKPSAISLQMVLEACPDIQLYGSVEIANWRDLLVTAQNVQGMMGINGSVWLQAQRVMGPIESAITLATLLQRLPLIQNPNGYLRKLTAKAAEGSYSSTAILYSLLRGQRVKS